MKQCQMQDTVLWLKMEWIAFPIYQHISHLCFRGTVTLNEFFFLTGHSLDVLQKLGLEPEMHLSA